MDHEFEVSLFYTVNSRKGWIHSETLSQREKRRGEKRALYSLASCGYSSAFTFHNTWTYT